MITTVQSVIWVGNKPFEGPLPVLLCVETCDAVGVAPGEAHKVFVFCGVEAQL